MAEEEFALDIIPQEVEQVEIKSNMMNPSPLDEVFEFEMMLNDDKLVRVLELVAVPSSLKVTMT